MNEHEDESSVPKAEAMSSGVETATELDGLIAEFLQMRDAGVVVERDTFMAKHVELRRELFEFFETLDEFEGTSRPSR